MVALISLFIHLILWSFHFTSACTLFFFLTFCFLAVGKVKLLFFTSNIWDLGLTSGYLLQDKPFYLSFPRCQLHFPFYLSCSVHLIWCLCLKQKVQTNQDLRDFRIYCIFDNLPIFLEMGLYFTVKKSLFPSHLAFSNFLLNVNKKKSAFLFIEKTARNENENSILSTNNIQYWFHHVL